MVCSLHVSFVPYKYPSTSRLSRSSHVAEYPHLKPLVHLTVDHLGGKSLPKQKTLEPSGKTPVCISLLLPLSTLPPLSNSSVIFQRWYARNLQVRLLLERHHRELRAEQELVEAARAEVRGADRQACILKAKLEAIQEWRHHETFVLRNAGRDAVENLKV